MVRFEVGTSSGVVCANFQIGTLGQGFHDLSVHTIFAPHFGLSSWRLKCTKYVVRNSDIVQ